MNNPQKAPRLNPDRPNPELPVKWLLGPQLLNSAKGILLYVAYGKKLDSRQWMEANVFPDPDEDTALREWQRLELARKQPAKAEPQAEPNSDEKKKGEFWFDYIADTGDGMKATYSIAYLCLSNLFVLDSDLQQLKAGDQIDICLNKNAHLGILPRGEFLFVGGDTTYHVSDYMTLASRVKIPFEYAYQDVAEDRRKSGDLIQSDAGFIDPEQEPNRPIFGIPGNHDYYDQLNGFQRQFRIPVMGDPTCGRLPKAETPEQLAKQPQLYLPGFTRCQLASYVALQLPFGWWLWGLDTEVGQIDQQQQKFFCELYQKVHPNSDRLTPPKLIVATSAPTTVFGKLADPEDEKSTDAFEQLDLEQLFLPRKSQDGKYEPLSTAGDTRMQPGECRLDISGDVHHYARYWGPKPVKPAQPGPVRKGATTNAPTADSYASVVSGIGGAFHHPSKTYIDEIQEQVLYPSEDDSTAEVAKRIFNPWIISTGGYVWLAGMIIAFTICFAATVTPSSRDSINALFSSDNRKLHFGETWSLWLGGVLLFLSPWPLMLPFLPKISKILFKQAPGGSIATDRKMQAKPGQPLYVDGEIHAQPEMPLYAISASAVLLLLVGFLLLGYNRLSMPRFGNSLIIQHSLLWAVAAIALSLRYSEFLFKKAHDKPIQWHDWALTWVLTGFGLLSMALGSWFFGKKSVPAYLVSDLLFISIVVGVSVGLIALPIFAGGELCQPKRKMVGESLSCGRKILRALFGLWHAILQIGVPFLLTRQLMLMKPSWAIGLCLVALLLLPALMWWIGSSLLKAGQRKLLALAWVVYGALMLIQPGLLARVGAYSKPLFPIELVEPWKGWLGLMPPLFGGLIGLVMACVWFGWYLGVCFAFGGHNNEVGGACRIEQFKQFIRFRLTEEGLTGYVIAIKDPHNPREDQVARREKLKPEIIDVFHLQVKK